MRVPGIRDQRCTAGLPWYSNAGGVAKEIDHILVSTRWRILQNCRVFRSAEFFATDHRLVVASLKLHIKSRKPPLDMCTVTVSNRFGVLDTLEDPEELWDTFKRETLEAAKECLGERPRSRSGFTSPQYFPASLPR